MSDVFIPHPRTSAEQLQPTEWDLEQFEDCRHNLWLATQRRDGVTAMQRAVLALWLADSGEAV